jgi:hypothetical protein
VSLLAVLRRPRTIVAAALAAFAGCNVPLDATLGLAPVNTCSASSSCAADAACVQGRCVATTYDLDHILLQVRPQAGAAFGAGTSYVIDPGAAGLPLVSSAAGSQPFRQSLDITLSAPATIHGGKVLLPTFCNTTDGSVPAQITFYRVPQLAGLPFDPVQATTTQTTAAGLSFSFDVSLASDLYDVYIEPQADPACSAIPPYFLGAQPLTSTSTTWALPAVGTLTGTINGLTDPAAWQVAVVEPTRGLPISTGNTLELAIGSTGATLTAQIFPIDPNAWPILRLTPVDPSRPTVYWSLQDALGGTQAYPEVNYTLQDLSLTQTAVVGQILSPDGTTGVDARLAIQSQTLAGANASNAAFSDDAVQTQPTGSFGVNLPPGTYAVRVFPTLDDQVSISDRQIKVSTISDAGACDCGIPLQLDTRATLAAAVTTPDGRPLASASAGIAPTQALVPTYLASTHSLGPLRPRVETTTTDPSGSFSLLADLGTIDLTVQPEPGSNLPWLVIPQITPDAGAAPSALAVPSPAFLSGTLYDPQKNPVANAEIDVWYPVRDPTNPTALLGTVVRIGTTSTDANGVYNLVLPSSVPSGGLK